MTAGYAFCSIPLLIALLLQSPGATEKRTDVRAFPRIYIGCAKRVRENPPLYYPERQCLFSAQICKKRIGRQAASNACLGPGSHFRGCCSRYRQIALSSKKTQFATKSVYRRLCAGKNHRGHFWHIRRNPLLAIDATMTLKIVQRLWCVSSASNLGSDSTLMETLGFTPDAAHAVPRGRRHHETFSAGIGTGAAWRSRSTRVVSCWLAFGPSPRRACAQGVRLHIHSDVAGPAINERSPS